MRMRVAVGGQLDLNITQGEVFRFVTSTILHGDLLHVFVNALAILGLGRVLEPMIGARRFLFLFSFGAVSASIGSYFAGVTQSDGASAGAFALLGLATTLGWVYRKDWDEESRRIMGPVLQGFVLLNVVLSLVLPFVDGIGHVFGLFVGVCLTLWMMRAAGRWGVVVELGWLLIYFATLCFGGLWVGLGWTARDWSQYWMAM